MNGFDWGKLIARLASLQFLFEAIDAFRNGLPYMEDPDYVSRSGAIGMYTTVSACLLISIGLWVFAGRFAPRDVPEEAASARFAGSAVIAGFAGFAFLSFSYSVIEGFALRQASDPRLPPSSLLELFFDLAVCVCLVFVIANSKKVAEWVSQ